MRVVQGFLTSGPGMAWGCLVFRVPKRVRRTSGCGFGD